MPANLVPLVLAAVKADPNLQPGTLSPFIEGYVRDVWGPAKLGRLKEAARTKLGIGNDAKADTSQIQAVVESLTEYGWMADRFTLSGTEMQTVAVEANRGKWKWREATRKKANKQYIQVAFDANAYKETAQYKSIVPGRQHHHGWVAAPPFFLPGNDERNGPMDEMTNKIYDSDMAHGTSPMEGVLYARVARSANRAAVPVLMGHVIGNESTATHRIYEDFMMKTYGDEFDVEGTVDIEDGDKGGDAAYKAVFEHARIFVCEHHAGQKMVLHGSSKADKASFQRAVGASKIQGMTDAIDSLSEKALAWVDARPQSELFPAALCAADGIKLHGCSASQSAESFNKIVVTERATLPAAGMYGVAKKVNNKYHRERQLALGHQGKVPPRVEQTIQLLFAYSKRYTQVGDNLNGTYSVKSAVVASTKIYTITVAATGIKSMVCNCDRVGTVDPYVCAHVCAVADKFNFDLRDYVPPWATTEAWKLQCCNAHPFPESFGDCLEGKTLLTRDELDCPPTTFTAKGRPKKSRQLGVLERNQAGKAGRPARVYFCSQCGHPGHTKRSCKGISEPVFHDVDVVATGANVAPAIAAAPAPGAADSSLPDGVEAAAAASANSSAANYSGEVWEDAGLPLDATELRLELEPEASPFADNHAAVQQFTDAEVAQLDAGLGPAGIDL